MKMLSPVHSATSPFVVEHDRFDASRLQAFHLGHDVVEVIERLDARTQCGGMIADGGSRDQLQSRLVVFGRIQRDVICDDDDLRIGRLEGVEPQRARAACDHQSDVGIDQPVALERFQDVPFHLLLGNRDLQANGPRGFVQAVDVLPKPKDFSGVAAHAFEHPVAVEQPVVVDADFGVFFIVKSAIDVDLQ
jgi:hypothetical protein